MLFVNDELEDTHPFFAEPKKVHPETEDEMARRIKSMLGDYVHEGDFFAGDCKGGDDKGVSITTLSPPSEILTDLMIAEPYNLNAEKDSTGKDLIVHSRSEIDVDKIKGGVCDKSDTIVSTASVDGNLCSTKCNDNNVASEAPGVNVRRSSLKRQCKEKISLLDYNPMFAIRTKRTKTNSSALKSKLVDCPKIPTLMKFPDLQALDRFCEVPDLDHPPLLDAELAPSCKPVHESTILSDVEENSFKVECQALPNSINDSDGVQAIEENNFVSLTAVTPQVIVKCKKQPKKKKRKLLYKSLPITNEKARSSSLGFNQDVQEQSESSNAGSCQLKQGVIKIRLSKLTDGKKAVSENDYEVSLCGTDSLFGCKALSVPLSPLKPSVYSAYSTSFKSKKKNRSSNKLKQSVKKMQRKNGLFQRIENQSLHNVNSLIEVTKENFEHSKSEMMLENSKDANINTSLEEIEVKNALTDTIQVTDTDKSNPEVCTKSIVVDPLFNSLHSQEHQESNEELKSTEEVLNDENLSSEQINLEHDDSVSEHINKMKVCDAQVLCSISLSLLDRIPPRSPQLSNNSDKEINLELLQEEKEASSIFTDSLITGIKDFVSKDTETSFKENSIKKEILTPPASDVKEIELDSPQGTSSPIPDVQNVQKDDACPELMPAYAYDILPGSKLASKSDLISVLQSDVSSNLESHNSHLSKIKVELPDAAKRNHEKWNEYKDYKWCHDFADVTYPNGSSIFKEQVSYSVTNHELWQNSELKKQYSSEYYLNEAKKLKHQADKEIDRMVQAMKYLEAVLYFILTGNAMEHSYIDTDRVHTMYKETLTLIRFISSKFQKLHNASCRNIDNKLTVLSLRCQSLLYLKMYQLRRDEVRYLHRNINTLLKSETGSFPAQGSPPHLQLVRQNSKHSKVSPSCTSPCSLIPSPAGSIASVSSQSSGYSSSEVGWNSSTVPSYSQQAHLQFDSCSDIVSVSLSKYRMLQQQSAYLANLHLCHDLWEHADYLSSKEHSREFFMELDEECGCLSLHSPFSALVHYVRKGLYKLKDGT